MRRSWFTCLNTSHFDSHLTWDEHRLRYLRLRRLVATTNENFLKRVQHERKLLLQKRATSVPKALMESTYCGYGEFVGRFYGYGNMNESAFYSRFKAEVIQNMDRISDDFYLDSLSSDDGDILPNQDSPNMDLQLEIELHCPLELAPVVYLENYESPDIESRYGRMINSRTSDHEAEFFLQINIHCPTSFRNRFPSSFRWLITSGAKTVGSMSWFSNDNCSFITTVHIS